jgi:hypothetical protein
MKGNEFIADLQDYGTQTALAVRFTGPDGKEYRHAVAVFRMNRLTPWAMAEGMEQLAAWMRRKLGPVPTGSGKGTPRYAKLTPEERAMWEPKQQRKRRRLLCILS